MRRPGSDQFAGCLVGQCLADASGFIVEGQSPDVCRRYVETVLRVGRVQGQRRGEYSFGQYSDDSQLARELLQSYADCGRFEPSDYARRIAAIFQENRIVGLGFATLQAALRIAGGQSWQTAGTSAPSAGNGSAMRAAPIGLLFHDDSSAMLRAAHEQGWITHQDPRCSAGAISIAGAVALAMRKETINPVDFCSQLSRWTETFDPILADALGQMPHWVHLSPEQAATIISKIGLSPNHTDDWEGISPFVTTSVLWSLYSFLRFPDNYWESVCTAIAVGGDVDTTAAMTGAIAGARVGLDGLPSSLSRMLTDRGTWEYHDLLRLAHTCHSMKSMTR